jgi:hypothetical protein
MILSLSGDALHSGRLWPYSQKLGQALSFGLFVSDEEKGLKRFTLVLLNNFLSSYLQRVLVLGKLFQPSLIFVGKVMILPLSREALHSGKLWPY